MNLTPEDFTDFFAALHPGQRPFAWQQRLLHHLLEVGRWPDVIDAPTGAGKTTVIDVHLFAQAVAPGVLPRRLVLTVNRRAIVDAHFEHAQQIRDKLTGATDGILVLVRDRLQSHARTAVGEPFTLTILRGGSELDPSWRIDPTAAAVICATPDMIGSRLLFRGFGTTRAARPIEAGLLAYDAALICDEAHLSRQLLLTARRISELDAYADHPPARPLQVVEVTATPTTTDDAQTTAIGVHDEDLPTDPVLKERLTAPKRLTVVEHEPKPGASGWRELVDLLARHVSELRHGSTGTVGGIFNTVALTLAVSKALHTLDPALRIVTITGRMRPHHAHEIEQDHPGLLGPEGNPDVDVLLGTQTLEVGIDIDLHGLVTTIAPSQALTQRLGRVNRRGHRKTAPVVVVTAPIGQTLTGSPAPYVQDDLDSATRWVKYLQSTDHADVSPLGLRRSPPTQTCPQRPLFQRLETWDAEFLTDTSSQTIVDAGTGSDSLELWIRDTLDEPAELGVIVRRYIPMDATAGRSIVTEAPPLPHEVLPVTLGNLARYLDERSADLPPIQIVHRDLTVTTLPTSTEDASREFRTGDILVLDSTEHPFTANSFDPAGKEHLNDVHEADPNAGPSIVPVVIPLRVIHDQAITSSEGELPDVLAEDLVDLDDDETLRLIDRARARALPDLDRDTRNRWKSLDLTNPETTITVVMGLDGSSTAIVRPPRSNLDDPARQIWSPRAPQKGVQLVDHEHAVANRTEDLANLLGLSEQTIVALRLAALLHDRGKTDPRFQLMLGSQPGEPDLAKSKHRSRTAAEKALAASTLPTGWRHEQLSAALVPSTVDDSDLVTRLVGTSHGRGRPSFFDNARSLTPDNSETRSVDLFTNGGWEALIETTHHQFGWWGCAYLEAILRAADQQISAEGR